MKPRQRLEQKQSSRLYLRRKDHRDIIMNDTYHNAMWLKKTKEDGTIQDELVWCKYPQNALMNLGINDTALGWLDTDRQFNYGIGFGGGQRVTSMFRLDEICVAFSDNGRIDYSVYTEDGIVWKQFKNNPQFRANNSVKYFGKNMLCSISGSTMYISLFEKNDDDEWVLENYTTTIPSGSIYCCKTDDGCIVAQQTYNADDTTNIYFHRVRLGLVREVGKLLNVKWYISSDYATRDCSRGNYLQFAIFSYYRIRYGYDPFMNQILALSSFDGGETWGVSELYYQETSDYSSWRYNPCYMDAFVRDDYSYVIFADFQGKCHLYRTLTTQWNEVELPLWVDLPLLESGGKCVGVGTKETIRVALTPSQTQGADINISNLIKQTQNNASFLNGSSFNIKFKDGELLNCDNEDEFLALYGGGYVVVFDNLRFISSSKSFAFRLINYSDATDGADTVQPNDYVIRP